MTLALFVDDHTGAVFSPCRRWRYRLWRRWDPTKHSVNFLMLNPSTADELEVDPTVGRCLDYTKRWGFGALIVTNLFAWRATDPDNMRAAADPVGPENDQHIVEVARECAIVVCAWGNDGQHRLRSASVRALLAAGGLKDRLRHLGITKEREPRHPLYLLKNLSPMEFGHGTNDTEYTDTRPSSVRSRGMRAAARGAAQKLLDT